MAQLGMEGGRCCMDCGAFVLKPASREYSVRQMDLMGSMAKLGIITQELVRAKGWVDCSLAGCNLEP